MLSPMRWISAAAMVLLAAGCGFDGTQLAGDASAPIDGAAPVRPDARTDRDGDGVFDDEDGCPDLADPAQLDEDGDQANDPCDSCPHLAGPQLDVGETTIGELADGVGDACDPRPDRGGDRLLLFDGFHGSELAIRWTASTSVTVADDALVLTDRAADYVNALTETDLGPSEQVTVVTDLAIEAVAPTTGAPSYRLVGVGWQVNPSSGYYCDLIDDVANGSPASLQLTRAVPGPDAYYTAPLVAPLSPITGQLVGQDHTSATGTSARCDTSVGGGAAIDQPDASPRRATALVVRAYGVDASVRWLVAFASPAP